MAIGSPATNKAQAGNAPTRHTALRNFSLIDGKLQLKRCAVDLGDYRISKQVHRRVEAFDVLRSDQRVQIERRPIGRLPPAGKMPVERHEGSTWVIPVVEEAW